MSSCPTNPPAPNGYAVWQGAVPPILSAWATDLLKVINKVPFGYTWNRVHNGQTILARKDHHAWTYRGGQLLTGLCIQGITLYRPFTTGAVPGDTDITNIEAAQPDPTLAVYDNAPSSTDWGLIAVGTGAAVGVVALFLLALKHAGKVGRRQ